MRERCCCCGSCCADRHRGSPGGELAAVAGAVGQWHQHRKNLPVKWTTTENIAWKLPMPELSGSTPIVWSDRIFLNVAEKGSLFLWAVDRNKGEPIWKRHLSDGDNRQRKQNMSTPSPVTDGTNVWVMTGTGILKAFDFAGKEMWMRDIQKEYGQFGLNGGTDHHRCCTGIRCTCRCCTA